ncbi:MAG: hypothetical protein Q7U82_04985 [Gammaproteobacteria bacterium]|nr:hypothetical protein [Gammaproteobacteria bacterium]
MNLVLILKLLLVPSLIGGVTLAGRRWGPSVAGWLSAFPVVSAPILFFISLEQGPQFAASAAAATLSAVLAILVFGIGYAWVATRSSWSISIVVAFAAYFVAVTCLNFWAPTLIVAAVAVFAALLIAPLLFPTLDAATPVAQSAPVNDIYLRMAAGAVLVLLVTQFSSRLGPQLSGVFAMFPVMSSVLVVFSHRHSGAVFAVKLLRGMVFGYYAFGVFCFILSLALAKFSVALAFVASLASAVIVQAASRMYLRGTQQSGQLRAAGAGHGLRPRRLP